MSTQQQFVRTPTLDESLFVSLYHMIQVVKIHQDNNRLVNECLTEFKRTISNISQQNDLTIFISEDRFYIKGEKLKYRKQFVRLTNALLDFFKRRELRGLTFHPSVINTFSNEILAFFRMLVWSIEQKEPADWLAHNVELDRFTWVSIVQENGSIYRVPDVDLREKARSTYFHALTSVKQVAQRISSQGNAGIRNTRRVVQGLVDCVMKDESIMIGLSTIKDYDDETYIHSVNVAALSICLGNRVGFSRTSLEHLGICGLFHDLGKVEIPREIITKPGDLNENEFMVVKKHPLSSVRQILKLHASHELKSQVLRAPYEHHIKYDLTGYPKLHFKKEISLFGRIIHIADVYDGITSPRAYRSSALSPHQALSYMLQGSGVDFDPILLKVFATMMGTYPVGTLLNLDTGEMGLVLDYPTDSARTHPRILLLKKDGQGSLIPGEMVDLVEKDPVTGSYKRNVVRTLNAASFGIQSANFVL